MRVILAFSPKMAPISKKHGKQGYGVWSMEYGTTPTCTGSGSTADQAVSTVHVCTARRG